MQLTSPSVKESGFFLIKRKKKQIKSRFDYMQRVNDSYYLECSFHLVEFQGLWLMVRGQIWCIQKGDEPYLIIFFSYITIFSYITMLF